MPRALPTRSRTAGPRRDLDLDRKLDRMGELMRRVVRVVRVPDDHADLTPTQLVVLSLLEDGPMRIGVLAAEAAAAQNTISEVVARLTRGGMVAKESDPHDRRAVLVVLTPAGRHALEARRRAVHDYHRSVLSALSARDRQRFVQAFETLVTIAETVRSQMAKSTNRSRRSDS